MEHRKLFRKPIIEGGFVFAILFLLIFKIMDLETIGGDNLFYLPTAISMVCEADLDVDEFTSLPEAYSAPEYNGHRYNYFPLGPSLLSLPVAIWYCGASEDLTVADIQQLNHWMASYVFAAVGALLYWVGSLNLKNKYVAVAFTVVSLFGSSMLSTGAAEYWQQTASLFCNMTILFILDWLLLGWDKNLKQYQKYMVFVILGLIAALGFISRPSNIFVVMGAGIWLVLRYWRTNKWYLLIFIASGMIVVLTFILASFEVFNEPLPPYYRPTRLDSFHLNDLLGLLFSPARGLLIYTPLICFSVFGFVLGWEKPMYRSLLAILLLVCVQHLFFHASYHHWWGGHSFGPRVLTDMLPFYLFPLVFLFRAWEEGMYRKLLPLFIMVVSASVFIHFRVLSPEVAAWNRLPVDVDRMPSRLWDWKDIPFLRGL